MKMLERQRVQQAAADAAKKLEGATKEAEKTARLAAAQVAHEEVQVSLSGSTSHGGLVGPLPADLRRQTQARKRIHTRKRIHMHPLACLRPRLS